MSGSKKLVEPLADFHIQKLRGAKIKNLFIGMQIKNGELIILGQGEYQFKHGR